MAAIALMAFVVLSATEVRAGALQVALHPSEVVDASASDAENVHALVTTELIRRGANLVSSDAVAKFLSGKGPGGCAPLDEKARVECLAQLAKSTGADRAILVNVAPYAGNNVVLTAQVVTASGAVHQDLAPFSSKKKTAPRLEDSIRPAVEEFVTRLDLSMIEEPLTPLTTVEPSTVPDGPSTAADASVTTPAPSSNGQRTVGYVLTGAGVVLLGAGAYGFVDAFAKRGQLDDLNQPGFNVADRQRVADLKEDARRSQTLGFVGTGLGAAAAAVGVWFLLSNDAPADSASEKNAWNWQLGPGYAGVSVALP